jgi:hypothetical protein
MCKQRHRECIPWIPHVLQYPNISIIEDNKLSELLSKKTKLPSTITDVGVVFNVWAPRKIKVPCIVTDIGVKFYIWAP